MTPEAQRIAIAEAGGFTEIAERNCSHGDYPDMDFTGHTPENDVGWTRLPDYLNDLNAMHEAEKGLTPTQQAQYAMMLHEMHGTPLATFWHRVICSTAAQRAEAFLRTIGKWGDFK